MWGGGGGGRWGRGGGEVRICVTHWSLYLVTLSFWTPYFITVLLLNFEQVHFTTCLPIVEYVD